MHETKAAVKAQHQFETYIHEVFSDAKNTADERQARKTRRQSDWVQLKGSQLAVFLIVVVAVAVVASAVTVRLMLGR